MIKKHQEIRRIKRGTCFGYHTRMKDTSESTSERQSNIRKYIRYGLSIHYNTISSGNISERQRKHLKIHPISSGNTPEHSTHLGIHQRDKANIWKYIKMQYSSENTSERKGNNIWKYFRNSSRNALE